MPKKIFNNLTSKDKGYLTHFYYLKSMNHKEKMEILTKKFDVSSRTIRRWWKEELNLTLDFTNLPAQVRKARDRKISKTTDILLLTTAQNKTDIHEQGFENIKAYKKELEERGYNVEIVIAPARYRNPTTPEESIQNSNLQEDWWRDELTSYLHYGSLYFGDCLFTTDSRVRPTAKNPLRGFETMAGKHHLIVPHSRTHFKTLPRFRKSPLRIMCTTGFITRKNYSTSTAGNIAYQHHSYGFVVVEKRKDGTCSIPRNVLMEKDGSFDDLYFRVENQKVTQRKKLSCFNWGDIHSLQLNEEFFKVSKKLIKNFIIKKQVMHDVLDGYSFNPHEEKDYYIKKKKIREGSYLIKKELDKTLETIRRFQPLAEETYIVQSNHDEFLDRYINNFDWKKDLHNSETYLELAKIQQTQDLEEHGCLFGYLVNRTFPQKNVTFLKHQDSLVVHGIEKAAHGDHGVNGAKGNYKTFSKLNTKMTHGHNHMSIIYDGVFSAALTCNKDQYYSRKGMSSWNYGHVVTYPSGKRQQWVFKDDYSLSILMDG